MIAIFQYIKTIKLHFEIMKIFYQYLLKEGEEAAH